MVPERAGRDANESAMLLQRMSALEAQFERLIERLDTVTTGKLAEALKPEPESGTAHTIPAKPGDDLTDINMETLGLFGLSMQTTGLNERRRALRHMHSFMPSADRVKLVLETFHREVRCSDSVLRPHYLEQCASDVAELRHHLSLQADHIAHMSLAAVTRLIYVEGLLFAIFGSTLFYARDLNMESLPLEYESMSAPSRFLKEAMIGLASLDGFTEPNIKLVEILCVLVWGLNSTRRVPIGMALHSQAVQIALLLNLHEEPPEDMPFEEARHRVQLYSELCIQDWKATTIIRRLPIIRHDKERLPSLFGTEAQQKKYLTPYGIKRLKMAYLYYRSSELAMPVKEDYAYVLRLHEETQEFRAHDVYDADSPSQSLKESKHGVDLYERMVDASLDYLLIRIHLPFYMRGWDDPSYRVSRDTCYNSARRLLRLFREAFSWKIPQTDAGSAKELYVPSEVSVMARMWFFCHWCTAAALLLLQHLTTLNERNEQPSWDSSRDVLVQDLCTMSRLLNYLSPVSSIAREGLEAMRRVAAHVMRREYSDDVGSAGHCILYWALQGLSARSQRGSATHANTAPMNVLQNMVASSGLSRDVYTTNSAVQSVPPTPTDGARPVGSSPSVSVAEAVLSASGSVPNGSTSSAGTPGSVPSVNTPLFGAAPPPLSQPAANDVDLDTFWARFRLPPEASMTEPPQEDAMKQFGYGDLPDPSALLMAPQPPLDLDADVTSILQQRDTMVPNFVNFNVGTIGSFTDDFIRSMDMYKTPAPGPGLAPGPPAPQGAL